MSLLIQLMSGGKVILLYSFARSSIIAASKSEIPIAMAPVSSICVEVGTAMSVIWASAISMTTLFEMDIPLVIECDAVDCLYVCD